MTAKPISPEEYKQIYLILKGYMENETAAIKFIEMIFYTGCAYGCGMAIDGELAKIVELDKILKEESVWKKIPTS